MSTSPVHFENIKGILLDIEGTTSSISFVYDEMFPFVRRELDAYLDKHWNDEPTQDACRQIVCDAGDNIELSQPAIRDEVVKLMDNDVKATGLKQLQGLIWKSGFESGELVAHVYDDVLPALKRWKAAGIDIRIYSSGSVAAQKLFFGHTKHGNLLDFFCGHYDTTAGPKVDARSYNRIASEFNQDPIQLAFFSDTGRELNAAKQAGWSTCLVARSNVNNFSPVISDFQRVEIS